MNTTTDGNDARIEHAVTLELERRARSRKIIWALLGLALIVAIMIMVYGNTERDAIRNDVQNNPEFASSVAMAVTRENNFLNEVAASEPIRKLATEQVEAFVKTDDFANSVAGSPEVRGAIEKASMSALSGLSTESVFQDAVKDVVSTIPGADTTAVVQNQEAIASLEQRWKSNHAPANVVQRIDEIETLVRQIPNQTGGADRKKIEALESRIIELDRALQQSRQEIQTLQRETARFRTDGAPHSYLLREKTTTALEDTELRVTLGPKTRDGKTSIQIVDSQGTVVFERAEIKLGESFSFRDSQGQVFKGALSFSQSRFWAKDFLGLELDQSSGER